MKIIMSFLLVLASTFSQLAVAMPIHQHCDIKQWGPITSSKTTTGVPADFRAGGNHANLNVFQPNAIHNAVVPPSANPNCKYELSDITQIDVKFTFEGTMTWNRINFSGLGVPVVVNPTNPISYVSGVARSFQFVPHQFPIPPNPLTPGPIERTIGQTISATHLGDNNGFKITAASITLRGNHYYIPEPSSILLFLISILALRTIRSIRTLRKTKLE